MGSMFAGQREAALPGLGHMLAGAVRAVFTGRDAKAFLEPGEK